MNTARVRLVWPGGPEAGDDAAPFEGPTGELFASASPPDRGRKTPHAAADVLRRQAARAATHMLFNFAQGEAPSTLHLRVHPAGAGRPMRIETECEVAGD